MTSQDCYCTSNFKTGSEFDTQSEDIQIEKTDSQGDVLLSLNGDLRNPDINLSSPRVKHGVDQNKGKCVSIWGCSGELLWLLEVFRSGLCSGFPTHLQNLL